MEEHRILDDAIGKDKVLIVNAAMEIKEIVPWQDAVTLIFKGKVNTLLPRADGSMLRSTNLEISKPSVVCLVKFHRRHSKQFGLEDEVTKTYIRQRDKFTCQYCGKYGNTVDHIQPQSRGGRNTWGNLVTACLACNGFKADRTPEEAGMVRPRIRSGIVNSIKYDDLQEKLHTAVAKMLY